MTTPNPAIQYRSTKTFSNYPCAHRQHRHKGNCALVHGYSRSFHFVFEAYTLDACGFAVDFGELGWLKDYLEFWFDHTMLLPPDDPLLDHFERLDKLGACSLRIMEYGVGMEGTAEKVCVDVDKWLRSQTKGRCWVVSVEARENDKNSAIYYSPEPGFRGWDE